MMKNRDPYGPLNTENLVQDLMLARQKIPHGEMHTLLRRAATRIEKLQLWQAKVVRVVAPQINNMKEDES